MRCQFTYRSRDLHFRLLSFSKYSIWSLVRVSVKRGSGPGSWSFFFFLKNAVLGLGLGLFRVRVRVSIKSNPDPKTAFFKKKIDPDPGPDPAFYWYPFLHHNVAFIFKLYGNSWNNTELAESVYWVHLLPLSTARPIQNEGKSGL